MAVGRIRTLLTILLVGSVGGAGASRALQAAGESNPPEAPDPPRVTTMRVPDQGIQPQVAVDPDGTVHLIYFKGDPLHGDILYVKSTDGGESFLSPLRVNSGAGSAVATGSMRGPHIVLGKNNRVHIAWNGSDSAQPRGPKGEGPVLYTRMNNEGTAFEPQRNLVQQNFGIDGGSSVAADADGNVYVVWHGAHEGHDGEPYRKVWIAKSTDEGKTFAKDRTAMPNSSGICACCGLRAFADHKGTLFILYRSSNEVVHRDMHLLASTDQAGKFTDTKVQEWNVGQCVMSTSAFAEGAPGLVATWETKERVNFALIDPESKKPISIFKPANHGNNCKHPTVAINSTGQVLVAWTEGTGWAKGGAVAWQVYDRDGLPLLAENGHGHDLPVWGTVAAVARADGSFMVIY